tara:strand:+ start:1069 stop:1206 length:138 start_codon:yes stop_codon:yes gene_type:complete
MTSDKVPKKMVTTIFPGFRRKPIKETEESDEESIDEQEEDNQGKK